MFLFPDSEGQHREVVTLLSVANKLVDGGGHGLDKLLRGTRKSCDNIVNTLFSK